MAGKSCIVSDQSGSGKTLAYLLPLIQRLRQEELQGLSKPSPQSPRVVILAPTTELASQVCQISSFTNEHLPLIPQPSANHTEKKRKVKEKKKHNQLLADTFTCEIFSNFTKIIEDM